MYSKQGQLIQAFYDALEPRAADAMFALLGQCQHDLEHRGRLSILNTLPEGASGAVLTVANYPIPPDSFETQYPSNGMAADFWGRVRFRGQAQFDQALHGDGIDDLNSSIAYIKVGLTTSNPTAQSIAASVTLEVAWSNDDTTNTDATVFSQDGADPSYPNILVAVAGTYRVFYKIGVSKTGTHTADEKLSVSSSVVRDRSGADTVVGGVDAVDVWHSETLGTFRQSVVGETPVECLAGDKLRIDMTMSSGPTREASLQYGEFCVMLLKRA